MIASLRHRGPDDSGVWFDDHSGVALGHRRLSILDLSPRGRQPMDSQCGRYSIVYNGEVYNYLRLRKELERNGFTFSGGADTEVMLAAIAEWGLVGAVRKFVGMFAFALWDREDRTLSLVRDRFGIKPLYYGWAGATFLFGSELKALRAYPGFNSGLDRDALTLYFRHNYIPAPHTAYSNAKKLDPGSILTLRSEEQSDVTQYWSALDVWNHGVTNPFAGTFEEAVDELDDLLADAVSLRMLSDVPLGALLSGGIDSSVVSALMQRESSLPIKTFSIGFHEAAYNEAQHAEAVSSHLGTDHTQLFITPEDLLGVVPQIPRYWDEPFSDSSQIPTYCLSKLTREHVTVALSGDGGDELFAGYERYFSMGRWRAWEKLPAPVRIAMGRLAECVPHQLYDALGVFGYRVQWRLEMLTMKRFRDFYLYWVSNNKRPASLVLGGKEAPSPMTRNYDFAFDDMLRQMTFMDAVSYLPDDILTKTDRASMASSLELRVPLLDHRIAEFAASLPTSMKVKDGIGKQVLREVLYRYVPRQIVDRPKMGFGVPICEWLGSDLKEWCCDMLNRDRIAAQGILDAKKVESLLMRFMNGETMWCHQLWDILMFQAWFEEWQ